MCVAVERKGDWITSLLCTILLKKKKTDDIDKPNCQCQRNVMQLILTKHAHHFRNNGNNYARSSLHNNYAANRMVFLQFLLIFQCHTISTTRNREVLARSRDFVWDFLLSWKWFFWSKDSIDPRFSVPASILIAKSISKPKISPPFSSIQLRCHAYAMTCDSVRWLSCFDHVKWPHFGR